MSVKVDIESRTSQFKNVPTFNERAAASAFLRQDFISQVWLLRQRARDVHVVDALHGALKEGLRVVDGVHNSGQGRRVVNVTLVHP